MEASVGLCQPLRPPSLPPWKSAKRASNSDEELARGARGALVSLCALKVSSSDGDSASHGEATHQ